MTARPELGGRSCVDGEYQPVSAAAAGSTFVMKAPFEFSVDPADLLDEAPEPAGGPERDEASGEG